MEGQRDARLEACSGPAEGLLQAYSRAAAGSGRPEGCCGFGLARPPGRPPGGLLVEVEPRMGVFVVSRWLNAPARELRLPLKALVAGRSVSCMLPRPAPPAAADAAMGG